MGKTAGWSECHIFVCHPGKKNLIGILISVLFCGAHTVAHWIPATVHQRARSFLIGLSVRRWSSADR